MARGTLGTGMMAPLQMANNFHGDYYAGPSGAAMGALMASQAIGDGFRDWGGAKGRSATGHILVTGPRLQCRSTGNAKGDRTGAWCAAPAIGDISCAMIASGTVLRWSRYAAGHCR